MNSCKKLIVTMCCGLIILNLSHVSNCFGGNNSYQLKSATESISWISAALNSYSIANVVNPASNVAPSAGNIIMSVPFNNSGVIEYTPIVTDPISQMNLPLSIVNSSQNKNSIQYKLNQGHVITIKYTIVHAKGENYYNFSISIFSDDSDIPMYSSQTVKLTSTITLPLSKAENLISTYPNLGCQVVGNNSVKQTETLDCAFPSKTKTSTYGQVPSIPAIPSSMVFVFNTTALKTMNSINMKFHANPIPGSVNSLYEANFVFYPFTKKTTGSK